MIRAVVVSDGLLLVPAVHFDVYCKLCSKTLSMLMHFHRQSFLPLAKCLSNGLRDHDSWETDSASIGQLLRGIPELPEVRAADHHPALCAEPVYGRARERRAELKIWISKPAGAI